MNLSNFSKTKKLVMGKLREVATLLLPPLIVKIIKKMMRLLGIPLGYEYVGVYNEYDEAVKIAGFYEQQDVVQAKAQKFDPSSISLIQKKDIDEVEKGIIAAIFYSFSNTHSFARTIIDFGGEMGIHYLTYLKVCKSPIKWIVVEAPMMASMGRDKWIGNQEIVFTDSLDRSSISDEDIVLLIASGVLQCLDNPYQYLEKMISLRPQFIYLDKLPILQNEESDFISVAYVPHQIYGISYKVPVWFFSSSKMMNFFQLSGYQVVFEFIVPTYKAYLNGKLLLDNYKAIFLKKVL